jgi:DNA repair protein RadA/Sms
VANLPLPRETAFAAELGLTGEIRTVSRLEPRIQEAARLGMKQFVISAQALSALSGKFDGIELIGLRKVEDLLRFIAGN